MLPNLYPVETAGDRSAMRAELSRLLGLDEPVPSEVLARAREDDHYAGYLLRSRGHPELLELLLNAPRNVAWRDETPAPEAGDGAELSSARLVAKAGAATLKWAATGFRKVDPKTLERRLAACDSCPHLRAASDRLVYRVTLSRRSDPRVCGACGCVASRKAALPGETCPVEDSGRPGFTRWQEPVRARA
jgi:hypothetical protein